MKVIATIILAIIIQQAGPRPGFICEQGDLAPRSVVSSPNSQGLICEQWSDTIDCVRVYRYKHSRVKRALKFETKHNEGLG